MLFRIELQNNLKILDSSENVIRKYAALGLLLTLLSTNFSVAQSENNFYLIDSSKIKTIKPTDKHLIDSILTIYHKETRDTVKLELLDFLSNSCSGDVWVSYNDLIAIRASELLQNSKQLSKNETSKLIGLKANSQTNKGVYYASIAQYDSAIAFYKRGLEGFEKIGEKNGAASINHNIGSLLIRQKRVDMGLEYLLKNIKNFKELNEPVKLATTYNSIAVACAENGQTEKGLYYLNEALKIMEPKGDSKILSALLSTMGSIYYTNNQKDIALKYHQRALDMSKRISYTSIISKCLDNIGQIYMDEGKFELTQNFLEESLALSIKENNKHGIAFTTGVLADNYANWGKDVKAEEYYVKSINMFRQLKNFKGISNTTKNLGKLHLKRNQLIKAQDAGLIALNAAKEIGYPENIQLAAELLKDVYIRKADWKRALTMQVLSTEMNDSLKNISVTKSLLKRDYEYEYRRTKLTDSLTYAKKKEIQDILILEQKAQLTAEKTKRNALVGFSFLLAILGVVSFRSYRNKQKQNKIILDQKEQVVKKNTENELLLGEIHHRVKNNLQVISSLLSLQEKSMENDDAKSAILEGKERVKSMELVHKMLYQENSFRGIEMRDYVNKLSLGLIESFGINPENIELEVKFKPITLDVDTAIPIGLILNELIVNSLKHAKSATEKLSLKISINENDAKQLQINIADNGHGKIAEVENSNSFGLKIIRALIRQLNGVMSIEERSGLSYSLTFNNYKLIA